MNIELVIGDLVKPEDHPNQYELQIDYMHGDADAYSGETFYFDNTPESLAGLGQIMGVLSDLCAEQTVGTFDNDTQNQANAVRTAGLKYGMTDDQIKQMTDNFLQRDTTDSSYDSNAQFEGIELFFIDTDLTKRVVTLEIDGKPVAF